jgi:hypothetical protein
MQFLLLFKSCWVVAEGVLGSPTTMRRARPSFNLLQLSSKCTSSWCIPIQRTQRYLSRACGWLRLKRTRHLWQPHPRSSRTFVLANLYLSETNPSLRFRVVYRLIVAITRTWLFNKRRRSMRLPRLQTRLLLHENWGLLCSKMRTYIVQVQVTIYHKLSRLLNEPYRRFRRMSTIIT